MTVGYSLHFFVNYNKQFDFNKWFKNTSYKLVLFERNSTPTLTRKKDLKICFSAEYHGPLISAFALSSANSSNSSSSYGANWITSAVTKKQRHNPEATVYNSTQRFCSNECKGYLYMSELGSQIRVLQHTGAKECDRLDAELPVQALIHDLWWDTEWQPVSEDRVSSPAPASLLHTRWRPLNPRRENHSLQTKAWTLYIEQYVWCMRIKLPLHNVG